MRPYQIRAWILAVAAMLLMPFGADAAGLGRLNVQSILGQPLNAEIELVSIQKNETVTARVAAPETYGRSNINFDPVLASARVTVQQRPNGEQYLRVTTSRAVNEPFLELIIELNSPHAAYRARSPEDGPDETAGRRSRLKRLPALASVFCSGKLSFRDAFFAHVIQRVSLRR